MSAVDDEVRSARTELAEQGHVTLHHLVPPDVVATLVAAADQVLDRDYETGIYPDECYYRPGTTVEWAPRHAVNVWKSNRTIARTVCSEALGALAGELFGWESVRLAVDTLWVKPAGAIGVEYHREAEYFSAVAPCEVASCWIALDAVDESNGALEFASGSHRWSVDTQLERATQQEALGRRAIERFAIAADADLTVSVVECGAGGATYFHGRVWHGSPPNGSDRARHGLGVHWVRGDARLDERSLNYVFGRYKLAGSDELHDSFFPLVWSRSGRRSPWLEPYLAGGPLGG